MPYCNAICNMLHVDFKNEVQLCPIIYRKKSTKFDENKRIVYANITNCCLVNVCVGIMAKYIRTFVICSCLFVLFGSQLNN